MATSGSIMSWPASQPSFSGNVSAAPMSSGPPSVRGLKARSVLGSGSSSGTSHSTAVRLSGAGPASTDSCMASQRARGSPVSRSRDAVKPSAVKW